MGDDVTTTRGRWKGGAETVKDRRRRVWVQIAIAILLVTLVTMLLNVVTHTDAPKANGWVLILVAVLGLLWSWLGVVRPWKPGISPRRDRILLWSWGYGLSVVYVGLLVTGLLIVIQGSDGPMT